MTATVAKPGKDEDGRVVYVSTLDELGHPAGVVELHEGDTVPEDADPDDVTRLLEGGALTGRAPAKPKADEGDKV